MSPKDSRPVTQILQAATEGDPDAADKLLPLVYDELRTVARARLRKLPPGQTLEPTALVHEAYLRVVGKSDPGWDGRGHFFAGASPMTSSARPSSASPLRRVTVQLPRAWRLALR